jgi:hypothetical protein
MTKQEHTVKMADEKTGLMECLVRGKTACGHEAGCMREIFAGDPGVREYVYVSSRREEESETEIILS